MTAPPPPLTVRVFTQRSEGSDTVAVIVAELTANAVTHGRVPGRDFELRLALVQHTVRIEVSDTRGERRPPGSGAVTAPPPDADHGRGLLLVEALAHRWTVLDRLPIGKTVRAELDLTPASRPAAPPPAPATP